MKESNQKKTEEEIENRHVIYHIYMGIGKELEMGLYKASYLSPHAQLISMHVDLKSHRSRFQKLSLQSK